MYTTTKRSTTKNDSKYEIIRNIKHIIDMVRLRIVSKEMQNIVDGVLNDKKQDPQFILGLQIEIIVKIIEMFNTYKIKNEQQFIAIRIDSGTYSEIIHIQINIDNTYELTIEESGNANSITQIYKNRSDIIKILNKFLIDKSVKFLDKIGMFIDKRKFRTTNMVPHIKKLINNTNILFNTNSIVSNNSRRVTIDYSKLALKQSPIQQVVSIQPIVPNQIVQNSIADYLETSTVQKMIAHMSPVNILKAIQELPPPKTPTIEELVVQIKEAAKIVNVQAQDGGIIKITNPLTGKLININGLTAKNLLQKYKRKQIKLPHKISKLLMNK